MSVGIGAMEMLILAVLGLGCVAILGAVVAVVVVAVSKKSGDK